MDFDAASRRVEELMNTARIYGDDFRIPTFDLDESLNDCVLHLENQRRQILSELSDIDSLEASDLDIYVDNLRKVLNETESQNSKISDEIESLAQSSLESSCNLNGYSEWLKQYMDFMDSQNNRRTNASSESSTIQNDAENFPSSNDFNFEIMKLSQHIEDNKLVQKSLQDLYSIFQRSEALKSIEDSMTGLNVVDFEGNRIKLLLKTYIPHMKDVISEQYFIDENRPHHVNHELVIYVRDGTSEVKNVEIFPNDVDISDITKTATSFSHVFSSLHRSDPRSALQWVAKKVQDRIFFSTVT